MVHNNVELLRELEIFAQRCTTARANGQIPPNWTGRSLAKIEIQNRANLTCINLRKLDLHGIGFSWTTLNKADFWATNLEGATFIGAQLSHANLSRANLTNSLLFQINLSETNLQNTCFRNARLRGVRFYSANLRNAEFEGATFDKCSFIQCKNVPEYLRNMLMVEKIMES